MIKTASILFVGLLFFLGSHDLVIGQSRRVSNRSNNTRENGAEGIAVSLRELQDATDSPEAAKLFGATRLLGFLAATDELGTDCILVFEKEPRRPALRLDDLAVAYLNIVDGDARPACTIDPRADVLKRLAQIGQRVGSAADPRVVERHLREWERIGKSAQDVGVFNVEPETHFASIMVEADYDLKTICNGAATAPGITSLTELVAKQVTADIARTGRSSVPTGSQNRFWFNPGRVSYRADGQLFVLGACEVTLLTEHEAITHEGKRTSASQPNPLAEHFAGELTKKFTELGQEKPVYRELENLYRAVAVMSLIVSEENGEDMSQIADRALRAVEIPSVRFKKTLPGRVSVKKLQGQVARGTYTLWMPSAGGVSIDIDSRMMQREAANPDKFAEFSQKISATRPGPTAISWTITDPQLFSVAFEAPRSDHSH